jgi:photosystem I subunit III
MKKILTIVLILTIWFSFVPAEPAQAGNLVPCKDSPAYQARLKNAPNTYYFDGPNKAYAEYLTCGEEDGLPHLVISFERATDIAIAYGIFFYFAGFVGWSGRSYLQASNQSKTPEQLEIFIDIPLAIQSFAKGLLWPLLFLQELTTGKLTAKDSEIPVSPR